MLKWLNTRKKQQLLNHWTESRALPIGRPQFEAWCDEIISAAMVTADRSSLIYALANMIMQLDPLEDHKPLAYFIKALRKTCVNQTAEVIRQEIFAARKAQEKALVDSIAQADQHKLEAPNQ